MNITNYAIQQLKWSAVVTVIICVACLTHQSNNPNKAQRFLYKTYHKLYTVLYNDGYQEFNLPVLFVNIFKAIFLFTFK